MRKLQHPMNDRIMPRFLTPRLRHCHDFEQVAVRVLEVKSAPAAPGVDLTVAVVVGPAAVGEPFGFHPAEDRLELRLANMKRVVMALGFRLVGEVKGQTIVDLHLREIAFARLDRQAENFREELG
jgi:hypothetical protein